MFSKKDTSDRQDLSNNPNQNNIEKEEPSKSQINDGN